ncbi:MAG: DUF1593 domain-containing protein [Saprospiraceae bacterium]|nr:DUF1593 domain-containing protein [Saprospiraceae bacterium]
MHSIVASGQWEYGIEGIGEGKSSPGLSLIIKSFLKDDPRPIYVVVNAGSNTLAQALIDFETRYSAQQLDAVVRKLRVFENGAQDNAGAWICSKYPDIHWIRSNYQTYCYGGPMPRTAEKLQVKGLKKGPLTWHPYAYSDLGQHQWTLEHVIAGHGSLGAYYPLRMMGNRLFFLEGGGTIPWLGLVNQGLYSVDHLSWGGWSGRFTAEKVPNIWSRYERIQKDEESYGPFNLYTEVADHWVDPVTDSVYHNVFAPVYRWRQAFFNDFKCRMDWCVADYNKANHNPVAAVNGDSEEKIHFFQVEPGKSIQLDAGASSDPDGDQITFHWWIYQKAGTYPDPIEIQDYSSSTVSLQIPKDGLGKDLHLILEISDHHVIASMYDYRRIVFQIR